MADSIRRAGEGRGFALARLLTHWPEVVGAETAAVCRPVRISHGRGVDGPTLVLLTTGAHAPRLEMALPLIRQRVNACYGFNAVARVTLTQTAATGFAEGQAAFTPAPPAPLTPRPETLAAADRAAEGIDDPQLAAALRGFALHFLSRRDANRKGRNP